MLISVFQSVCWYIIYLNQLFNVVINWCHWTLFDFVYIYFPKIAFVVMMWTVFLWLSMAISDLLLWTGYWNIALSKTKGNFLTELCGSEFLKNVCFMQLVTFTLLLLYLITVFKRYNLAFSHNDMVLLEKCKERSSLGRHRFKRGDNIKTGLYIGVVGS
jgi:hypothetical protein